MTNFSHRFLVFRKINISLDAVIAVVSLLAAVAIRSFAQKGNLYSEYLYRDHMWMLPVVFIVWPLVLRINGLYPTDRLRKPMRAMRIIAQSCVQALLFVLGIIFVFKVTTANRAVIGIFFLISTAALLLKEVLVIRALRVARSSGKNIRFVLVVGTPNSAKPIIRRLRDHPYLGLHVSGVIVPEESLGLSEVEGVRIAGALEQVEEVLHANPIDHVIITIDKRDYSEVENIIFHCEEEGVEVWVTADIFNITFAKMDSGDFFGVPMLIFRTVPLYSWQLFFKSLIDYSGAMILAVLSLPILALAAILIKITSPGPVLFCQKRSGLQGREFTLYKLRTMRVNAHKAVESLKAENLMTGPVFKMKDDPRITPLGKYLRKFSIDELPQLWNVLLGDMSLVGPRPPIPDEVSQYKGWQRRRLSMKPGITGLWQVSGRNQITQFDEWVNLDLEYIDKWSLWLDIKILAKTILVVLTSRGAH